MKKEDEEENHRAATVVEVIAECKSCLGVISWRLEWLGKSMMGRQQTECRVNDF